MIRDKKILLFIIALLITLIARDMPYINVFIIDKIWVIYAIFIVVFSLLFIPLRFAFFSTGVVILFSASIVFTLLKYSALAEISGLGIYFFLWVIVIYKIRKLIQSPKD